MEIPKVHHHKRTSSSSRPPPLKRPKDNLLIAGHDGNTGEEDVGENSGNNKIKTDQNTTNNNKLSGDSIPIIIGNIRVDDDDDDDDDDIDNRKSGVAIEIGNNNIKNTNNNNNNNNSNDDSKNGGGNNNIDRDDDDVNNKCILNKNDKQSGGGDGDGCDGGVDGKNIDNQSTNVIVIEQIGVNENNINNDELLINNKNSNVLLINGKNNNNITVVIDDIDDDDNDDIDDDIAGSTANNKNIKNVQTNNKTINDGDTDLVNKHRAIKKEENGTLKKGILGYMDREIKIHNHKRLSPSPSPTPSATAATICTIQQPQTMSDPTASPAQRSTRSRSSLDKSPRHKRSKSESRRRRERKLIAAGELEVRQANETLMRYLKQCSEINDASLSGELEIDKSIEDRRVQRKTKSQRERRMNNNNGHNININNNNNNNTNQKKVFQVIQQQQPQLQQQQPQHQQSSHSILPNHSHHQIHTQQPPYHYHHRMPQFSHINRSLNNGNKSVHNSSNCNNSDCKTCTTNEYPSVESGRIPPSNLQTILHDLSDDIIPINGGEVYNPFTPVVSPTDDDRGSIPHIDKMFIQTSRGYSSLDNRYYKVISIDNVNESDNNNRYSTDIQLLAIVQRTWILITNLCHGLLGGLALAHLLFILTTKPFDWNMDENSLKHFTSFANLYSNVFYTLAIICVISILDRMDICQYKVLNNASDSIKFKWIIIVMIYIAVIILNLSNEVIDERLYLLNTNNTKWEVEMENNRIKTTWNSLSIARSVGGVFGWILVGLSYVDDIFYDYGYNIDRYH